MPDPTPSERVLIRHITALNSQRRSLEKHPKRSRQSACKCEADALDMIPGEHHPPIMAAIVRELAILLNKSRSQE